MAKVIKLQTKKDLTIIKQILTILLVLHIAVIVIITIASLCLAHQNRVFQQDLDDYLENQQEIEWIDSLPENFED